MNRAEIAEMREEVRINLDRMFAEVDSNNDEWIERHELMAQVENGFQPLPPHLMKEGQTAEDIVNKFFELSDVDKNNKVSKDELRKFFNDMLDEMEAALE